MVQVSVHRIQKLTGRGKPESAADVSPGHLVVEAVCVIGSGLPSAGAEAIGETLGSPHCKKAASLPAKSSELI